MNTLAIVLVALIALFAASVSSAVVTVDGRRLLVDGKSFFVKSVGYSPVPIGVDASAQPPYGDYFTNSNDSFYVRDIPVLKALGTNALKLWGWNISADHSDFLDLAIANDIWVIPTFWMGPGTYPNLADSRVIAQVTADFQTWLSAINNHPAVLFYNIGSDLNADWNYGAERDAVYSLIDKLAALGKSLQPANASRPFSTALNDQHALEDINKYEASTPNIAIWSVNAYRGCSFKGIFTQFAAASRRPLFISEFGIDAFNDQRMTVDEPLQAACVSSLWGEIVNGSVSIGGAIVEYQDEWWKGKLAQADARHPGCPNYNASFHSNCGYPSDFPDSYTNQAWFGIVDEDYAPREVFTAIQKLWKS